MFITDVCWFVLRWANTRHQLRNRLSAIKFLKHVIRTLRLIVISLIPFRDTGGIYQGGNWIYGGKSARARCITMPMA